MAKRKGDEREGRKARIEGVIRGQRESAENTLRFSGYGLAYNKDNLGRNIHSS